MIGRVHSIESFGTVDGPGIRMVIFLSGCPMRCLYCHNPDTWDPKGGTPMTVEQLLNQYDNARHFYRKGGITVSGGEPLTQIGFVTELFEAAKKRGIHTCLDTSGVTFRPDSAGVREKFDRLAAVTDLVLLDIKHIDPQEHLKLCGQPQDNILAFARYLEQKQIPVWVWQARPGRPLMTMPQEPQMPARQQKSNWRLGSCCSRIMFSAMNRVMELYSST